MIVYLIIDDVSHTFHNHGHKDDHGHGHGHGQGHGHGHAYGHEHVGHLEGPAKQSVIDTVAHIGGLSIGTLESAFKSTGLLEEVKAKTAFSGMKEKTEFSFVLASGRKK